MSMTRRGSIYVVALAAGLLGGAGAAYAGRLSLSVSVPGASVAAGPGGVAVGVAQPGFYGELSVGNLPAPPPVIYTQPVIVTAAPCETSATRPRLIDRRAEVGAAWWLLCNPSPAVINASHCTLVADVA